MKIQHSYDGFECDYMLTENGGAIITKYGARNKPYIVVPNHIEGHPVVSLAENAFRAHDELRSVTIQKIYNVGPDAFSFCMNLKDIYIGSGVKNVGSYAFSYCHSLETVYISDLEQMECGAFQACRKLKEVKFSPRSTIHIIPEHCFHLCESLAAFELPDSVIQIGESAFEECSSLNTIDCKNTMFIGDSAFQECKSLETVVLSPNLVHVGEFAFFNCPLPAPMVPIGSTVGENAFSNSERYRNEQDLTEEIKKTEELVETLRKSLETSSELK